MSDTKEVGYKLRTKKITTPKKLPTEQQVRDTFHTPRYATNLLLPYIPTEYIWECAAGAGDITRALQSAGKTVYSTDLLPDEKRGVFKSNFLTDEIPDAINSWAKEGRNFSIITNPPFSIKELFVEQCRELGVPFALLINADYSQWSIDLVRDGCEKIIPTRRISFITPNILSRIHEGQVWKQYSKDMGKNLQYESVADIKERALPYWDEIMSHYHHVDNYSSVSDVPGKILKSYSSSQFHSMWLTFGFGLGRSETFVELPLSEMENF
jgi:hypothetical protein